MQRLAGRGGGEGGVRRLVRRPRREAERQLRLGQRQQRLGVADEGEHRLAAEPCDAVGKHRLVAQVGEDREGVVRHVGGGEHVDDARPAARNAATSPSVNAACGCGERTTRIASTPAGSPRPGVGAEALVAAHLGRRVEPGGAAADRACPLAATGAARPRPPPRRAPLRRSWCSRCSGRARRPARRAPRPRSASGWRAAATRRSSACPACRCRIAPRRGRRRRAAGSRARRPDRRGPSTVVTARPSHWPTATMQAQTCSASSSTVQAPQSPAWQPILVPVRPSSSRSASESRRDGSPTSSRALPLTCRRTICRASRSRAVMARTPASARRSRVSVASRR